MDRDEVTKSKNSSVHKSTLLVENKMRYMSLVEMGLREIKILVYIEVHEFLFTR